VRELAYDNLFIFCWKIYETANLILLKFLNETENILKFKILQRMHRKFPAKPWKRQNVILFYETIPLISRTIHYFLLRHTIHIILSNTVKKTVLVGQESNH
jgi:hypothetical protein